MAMFIPFFVIGAMAVGAGLDQERIRLERMENEQQLNMRLAIQAETTKAEQQKVYKESDKVKFYRAGVWYSITINREGNALILDCYGTGVYGKMVDSPYARYIEKNHPYIREHAFNTLHDASSHPNQYITNWSMVGDYLYATIGNIEHVFQRMDKIM